MLTHLFISNVVLIEKLELEFSSGLTIFSGETGAGKSILLDSLGLVLGARAETGLIKTGADKLNVTAEFEIQNRSSPVFKLLSENEIDADQNIIIKRTLSRDGKGKIFLNDQPISLKLLKEIGSHLVEIHGQFDSQGLLNPLTHIDVLDSFGEYSDELLKTKEAFKKYKDIQKRLTDVVESYNKNIQEEETLTHFKNELENAKVRKGEEKELTEKRTEMMHAEKLIEQFNIAYQSLQGEGLAQNIRHALNALDKINRITENKYKDIEESLNSALIELDEATAEIENASSNISLNSDDINAVEERLFALKALARKHNCTIDDLPEVLENIKNKLNAIENNGQQIIILKGELTEAKNIYLTAAARLHDCRQRAADILSGKVQDELQFLKMGKAEFRVLIQKADEEHWCEKGFDLICFEVKTNAGQPFGPLNKIASGGELSRFMLALKVNLAEQSGLETLIFDEIDSGIGGSTAEAVGNRLYKLSKTVQVMAVTHAPQVASFGTTNFKVSKQTHQDTTSTEVTRLNENEKREEIARMLSGEKISNEARAAAEKLIEKPIGTLF